MKLCLLLALLCPFSDGKDEDPGVKGRVTLKGFQYGWQVGVQELQQRLASIQVPDVSGSISVPVIGTVWYSVTRLQIRDLQFPESDVSLSSNTGVKVSVSQGQVWVTGFMRISTVLGGGSAGMELSVTGLSLSGVLGVTRDDSGHGAVWNAGCSSSVGDTDVHFHGGSGWLFNLFRGAMQRPVHDALSTHLCPEFDVAIARMETIMSSLPVALLVDSVAVLEFSLVAPPLITERSLELPVKGQFVGFSERWDPPFPPEQLPLPDLDSRMLLFALSQFSVNSAGYVHYKSGILRVNVTDDMIPKLSPLRLNTKSLGIFVPELQRRFPDPSPVLLHVSARAPPSVSCQPDALTLQVSADIQAFAIGPDQTITPLFQLQMDMATQVDVLLSEESLGAVVNLRNLSLSLTQSDVGLVKVDALQNMLNMALKIVLLPLVNERLKNVFSIPNPRVHLQNPMVHVLQGYLLIVTDVQISPEPDSPPRPGATGT
ncbi:LOW QUALITY PROTEIN: bactericidal permeability-increasing protein-like [Ascaphus truei]|uniref:LOW QUALITY PROTEIN: bactericidal permeability-increasing protein-like n=1 Tax=Ascaphus truei TaxID=8439 RepID=UPI003F5A3941